MPSDLHETVPWAALFTRIQENDQAALAALKGPVEEQAGLIGRSSRFKDKLVKDSWSTVWQKSVKTRPSFASDQAAKAWCKTVLLTLLCNLHRESARQVATISIAPSHDIGRADQSLIERLFQMDQLASLPEGDPDLAVMEAWSPIWRTDLLCLAGLWLKIPKRTWSSWIEEAGLPEDYPSADLASCADRKERSVLLADFRGCDLNRFHKIWSDHSSRLLKLRFVQEALA